MVESAPKGPSPRRLIADRIANFILTEGLNKPYGGEVLLYRGGKFPCYTVAFSLPRSLNGDVAVYSPSFLQLRFQTSLRDLPEFGDFIFRSEADLVKFLTLAFVKHDYEAALALARAVANAKVVRGQNDS